MVVPRQRSSKLNPAGPEEETEKAGIETLPHNVTIFEDMADKEVTKIK